MIKENSLLPFIYNIRIIWEAKIEFLKQEQATLYVHMELRVANRTEFLTDWYKAYRVMKGRFFLLLLGVADRGPLNTEFKSQYTVKHDVIGIMVRECFSYYEVRPTYHGI